MSLNKPTNVKSVLDLGTINYEAAVCIRNLI